MSAKAINRKLRWAYLPECEAPAEGWSVVPFASLCDLIAGQSPSSDTYNEQRIGLPFLQGNGDFSDKHPKPKAWCTAPAKLAEAGDTLISVRAPVGEINRADQRYAIGRGLAAIRARDANPDFIHQAIQRWRWSLQRVAQGTTFDAVTARHFAQLLVAVPNEKEEQAAIACVLGAVDEAIEKSIEAASNAKKLSAVLLNDTIQRCVKRFTPERLSACIEDGPTNGLYRPESDYGAKGTPIVRIDSFADGTITDLKLLRRVALPAVLREKFALSEGDVLINRVNALTHVGKAALVPSLLEPTLFESNIMRLRCNSRLLPEFLNLVLRSDLARRHWLARSKPAVNQVSINQRDVKELHLPVPDIEEQWNIAAAVAAADAVVCKYQDKLAAFEALKKSLMHDLLTGAKRINPALFNQTQEAIPA